MPPIGDMAWAASPIASRPGLCQRCQPVELDAEQVEVGDLVQLGEIELGRRRGGNLFADRVDPAGLKGLRRALRNDEGALPIVAAVDHDEESAALDIAAQARPGPCPVLASRNQKTSIGAPRSSTGRIFADNR